MPHGLYRTSVPVQYSYTSTPPIGRTACTKPQCLYSTAIPLLPLLAVRPVNSLSACTVQLYLYSPCWPYCLYRASVPVQGCTSPFPFYASHNHSSQPAFLLLYVRHSFPPGLFFIIHMICPTDLLPASPTPNFKVFLTYFWKCTSLRSVQSYSPSLDG